MNHEIKHYSYVKEKDPEFLNQLEEFENNYSNALKEIQESAKEVADGVMSDIPVMDTYLKLLHEYPGFPDNFFDFDAVKVFTNTLRIYRNAVGNANYYVDLDKGKVFFGTHYVRKFYNTDQTRILILSNFDKVIDEYFSINHMAIPIFPTTAQVNLYYSFVKIIAPNLIENHSVDNKKIEIESDRDKEDPEFYQKQTEVNSAGALGALMGMLGSSMNVHNAAEESILGNTMIDVPESEVNGG